ncbi:MAG TPA: hypothetical protein V6D08_11350 [Candidatus Obscuribacterales bacterium]
MPNWLDMIATAMEREGNDLPCCCHCSKLRQDLLHLLGFLLQQGQFPYTWRLRISEQRGAVVLRVDA